MPILRRIRSIVALLILLSILAGCGGGSDDQPTQASSSQRQGTEDTALVTTEDDSIAGIAGNELDTEAERGTGADTFDADGDGFLTVEEHRQAFESALSMYQWPSEYTPTIATMLRPLENSQPGDLFQIGVEQTVIGSWNECAWYMAWLDAFREGNDAAQAEALEVMGDVLPAHSSLDLSAADYLREVADSAALGDPSQVASRVEGEGGCRDLVFDGP